MHLLLILFVVFVIGFSIYSEMTSSTLSKERFTLLLTLWWILSIWILRQMSSAVLYFAVGAGLLVLYLAFLWNYSSFSRAIGRPISDDNEKDTPEERPTGFREAFMNDNSTPTLTEKKASSEIRQILQTEGNNGEYSLGNMLKTWQTLKTVLPIV